MKPDDPRAEAASLARSLKRKLEREQAAGTGELLARGARARREAAPVGLAAHAPSPAAVAAYAEAPAPAAVAAPLPPAEEFDLFGNRIPRPVPKPVTAAAEAAPQEQGWNPADPGARRAIVAASEPVLAQIAAEVNQCQKCALWESRNRAVPGVGTALSGIVFIGEAPGADEDRLGEPFVGRAGQLLDRIIQAMDDARLIPGVTLSRATVFIGNILHCRPPENRVPLPFEIEQSSPYLRRQIEALKPRVIVCLGTTAAHHLLGFKASLASMRGKVYRYLGAKLIVTYHPAACLRNPDYKRPVWEDMQLLAREYHSE